MSFIRIRILTASIAALAVSAPVKSHGAERFQSLLKRIDAAHVTTVDDAIPLLGPEMLSSFTFMYSSRSIQGALPAAPRAVVFGKDAKFIVSFNGDPSLAGNKRLEIIEFNDVDSRFEFKTLSEANGKLVSDETQSNCFGCHGMGNGQDLKPVWDIYPVWRGAYGSQDDDLHSAKAFNELSDYVSFLKTAATHPRYGKLIFDFNRSPVSPYGNDLSTRTLDDRPNLRLSTLLHRLQAKRVARELIEMNVAAPSLRSLLSCTGFEIDLALKAEIEKRIHAYVLKAFKDETLATEISQLHAEESTILSQIATPLGYPLHDWTLTLEKNANVLNDGGFSFNALVAHELYANLMQSNPVLKAAYGKLGLGDEYGHSKTTTEIDALGGQLTASARQTACETLTPKPTPWR
jgi:hypothetical protein